MRDGLMSDVGYFIDDDDSIECNVKAVFDFLRDYLKDSVKSIEYIAIYECEDIVIAVTMIDYDDLQDTIRYRITIAEYDDDYGKEVVVVSKKDFVNLAIDIVSDFSDYTDKTLTEEAIAELNKNLI